MFPVVDAGGSQPKASSLVKDRVKAWEETHVDDENGDDPDDENHDNFDDGEASGFPFTSAARTKRIRLGVGQVQMRQHDMLAVAVTRLHLNRFN